jgi:hypothetical protein
MKLKIIIVLIFSLATSGLFAQFNKSILLTTDNLRMKGRIISITKDTIFFQNKNVGFRDAVDLQYVSELIVRKRRDYRLLTTPLGILIGILPGVYISTLGERQETTHVGGLVNGLGGALLGIAGGITGGYYGYKLFKPKIFTFNINGDKHNLEEQKAILKDFITY